MGAPTKRARKIRFAGEFDVSRLRNELQPPKLAPGVFAWSMAKIVEARDTQMIGRFNLSARLAEAMRTNDSLFVAYSNRLDALASIEIEMRPAKGARAKSIADEGGGLFGQTGIAISPDTLRDFHGCLVDHGVAFAGATPVLRDDGTRVDYTLKYWPIEFVRWDPVYRAYRTRVHDAPEETVLHGDGRWVVAQLGEFEPFKKGAAIPSALVWARAAFALRDWAKGSVTHGNAKVIGKMAEGVPLQVKNEDGTTSLSPDAAAFIEVLKAIANGDTPVGIIPAGASVEYLTNTSKAYEVWVELVANAEKAAARIYLGTDGVLGSNGGAPGVDISALFGVATTKIQGDRKAIERALQTGLIEPWAAINFGDSSLAPYRKYKLPDADADADRASLATRTAAFYDEIDRMRASGFAVTPGAVAKVAAKQGVDAPDLAPSSASAAAQPGESPAASPTPLRVAS